MAAVVPRWYDAGGGPKDNGRRSDNRRMDGGRSRATEGSMRCLGCGHVRAMCRGTNRGATATMCHVPRHGTAECQATRLDCSICASLDRATYRRMGGKACNPPDTRRKASKNRDEIRGGTAQRVRDGMDTGKPARGADGHGARRKEATNAGQRPTGQSARRNGRL